MQTVSIRKGVFEDLPQVLELIRELAIYEKEEKEVTITLKDLETDGFGNHPLFGFFVAEVDKKIVGIALYYLKYSTWKGKCLFLEDLIVTETHRKSGIGKQLFNKVIQTAKEMNAARMEWQVLEWNAPAIGFYKSFETVFDAQWVNCKLIADQIQSYTFE